MKRRARSNKLTPSLFRSAFSCSISRMTESRRDRYAAWGLTWLAYASYYFGRKGFSVVVYDVDATKRAGVEAAGGRWAQDVRPLSEESQVVARLAQPI